MSRNITATFVKKRRKDSGRDQAPDYYIYEFTDIRDSSGNIYGDKWIKETKLIQSISLIKGASYSLVLSDDMDSNVVNMPYPTKISDGNEQVHIKGGNTIIKTNSKGEEQNLSNIFPRSGNHTMLVAALNKFQKGKLTEELLLKWNEKGTYFHIQYVPGKNIFGTHTSASETKTNYVLIQKVTQTEIDRCLESIKRNYLNSSIESHFSIDLEITTAKKKK